MMTKKARATWLRPYFVTAGAPNFHYLVVYGNFTPPFELPVQAEEGIRAQGLEPLLVERGNPEFDEWPGAPYFAEQLRDHPDGIAGDVAKATNAVLVKRTCEDVADLFDLRSSLTIIKSAFGWGGCAVADPLAARWWSRKEWVSTFVDRQQLNPLDHVSIFVSDDWVHTRGMRKFGRPDLSIRNVPIKGDRHAAAIALVHRFVDFLARGGMMDVTRRIDADGYPPMPIELHAGDAAYDDPDFNNEWVEIIGYR
jgi:hypothetical protein